MGEHAWGVVDLAQVSGTELSAPCVMGEEAEQERKDCSWQWEVEGLSAVAGGDGIVVRRNPAAVLKQVRPLGKQSEAAGGLQLE